MLKKIFLLLMVASVWACKGAKHDTIPVDEFFKTQDKAYYRISPDGKSLSYLKNSSNKKFGIVVS